MWEMGQNTKDSVTVAVLTEVRRKCGLNIKSSIELNCSTEEKRTLTAANAVPSFTKQLQTCSC